MLALLLSQILVDALQDLVDHPNQDPVTLLVELKTEEDDLMERFLKAVPEAASKLYDTKKDRDPDVDSMYSTKVPVLPYTQDASDGSIFGLPYKYRKGWWYRSLWK
jgi:hypothetical protein